MHIYIAPFFYCIHYEDGDDDCSASAASAAIEAAVLLLRLFRFGKGVVGNLGGSLVLSLSPSSVSFVTLRPIISLQPK
jgi:hypothetical protein